MLKAVDVNAPNLAAAFYAEGVISDDVLEEFYSNTSKNQTLKLLHSVLKIIETHPKCFSKVCTALEKDYASTAKSLKGIIQILAHWACSMHLCVRIMQVHHLRQVSFVLCVLTADEFKSYLEHLTKDKANGKHETLTKELSQGYN